MKHAVTASDLRSMPYHVRIAISQYGDHFRAELFTEDLGDTDGDLINADWPILDEHWSDFLMGGSSLSSDNARDIGRELFAKLLGGAENAAKWQQILQISEREQRPIRILIDSSTDDVRNLPFGPRKGKPGIRFVRIIRRCTPRSINLKRKPLRMLLAVAEPAVTALGFNATLRLFEMVQSLATPYEISVCTQDGYLRLQKTTDHRQDKWEVGYFAPFVRTTRTALRTALEQGKFDILHLMAHGQKGDICLMCDSLGKPDPVSAGELGEWCRGNLQLAFLQACKASFTGEQGGFGGIAQQLLNPEYGDLAAVVASPYPIDAEKATSAALEFYRSLLEGRDLDESINRIVPNSILFGHFWKFGFALGLWDKLGLVALFSLSVLTEV